MTVQVHIENNGLGAIAILKYDVSAEDFFQETDRFYQSPDFLRMRYFIYQTSDLDSVKVDMTTLRRIAERDKAAAAKVPGFQISVVAQSEFLQALAHVWQDIASSDNLRTKLFESLAEARAWVETACVQDRMVKYWADKHQRQIASVQAEYLATLPSLAS